MLSGQRGRGARGPGGFLFAVAGMGAVLLCVYRLAPGATFLHFEETVEAFAMLPTPAILLAVTDALLLLWLWVWQKLHKQAAQAAERKGHTESGPKAQPGV